MAREKVAVFYDDGEKVVRKDGYLISETPVFIRLQLLNGRYIRIPICTIKRIEEAEQDEIP